MADACIPTLELLAGSRCAQPCMALANGAGPCATPVRYTGLRLEDITSMYCIATKTEHVVVECKGIRRFSEDRT